MHANQHEMSSSVMQRASRSGCHCRNGVRRSERRNWKIYLFYFLGGEGERCPYPPLLPRRALPVAAYWFDLGGPGVVDTGVLVLAILLRMLEANIGVSSSENFPGQYSSQGGSR